MRIACFMALFFITICLLGCGGDGLNRVPIQGVLTSQGEPINGATVLFIPAAGTPGEGGIGQTDAAGKFTLISSRQSDTGIPPGKYTVRVTRLIDGDGTILPPDVAEADYPMSRESIPAPYSGDGSPLETTISEQGGEIKLEIPVAVSGSEKS